MTRTWDKDGQVRNATDADQMAQEYIRAYSPTRAASLLRSALDSGHPAECLPPIQKALDELDKTSA